MEVNKVFLVDDDEIFRTAAEILIKSEGLTRTIEQYKNGLDAYNKLLELAGKINELPDIILLDINMPLMNGWEFLEELRMAPDLINDQVHIYILTSSIAPDDLNLSKEYGFIRGYITKPLTKADVNKMAISVSNPSRQI
ncbi:response regulator [Flagellimonas pacifica]|uniref:Response regulator receiver domain-containing protein n=1 Tax=Flagellimonas pacifica TaxID=1247520 RepID=A0A285MCT4_9FLAO|nr:response regulator [Allomuricauda parva]SNY94939.1 Response regulator receiver domain-containing protein [Allomuricauda parva]